MDRNSSKDCNLVIKAQHGDTLRRFGARVHEQAMDIDMAKLRAKIVSLFKFKPEAQIALTYTDEDGDTVTLDSDDELRDAVILQCLNPLRINVQLLSADPSDENVSREASGLPRIGTQPSQIDSALSELLKSVPEPLRGTVARVSNDVSKAALSSPVLADILHQVSKLGLATASHPFQAPSGSSVSPVGTSADLQDLNINDRPAVDQPILNNEVKEKHNKQSESGNAEINVGKVHTTQNAAFSDLLSSGWTIGDVDNKSVPGAQREGKGKAMDNKSVPGAQHEGKGKAVNNKSVPGAQREGKGKAVVVGDVDVSAPRVAFPSEDKQSLNSGTVPVDNELHNTGNKQSPFGSASMVSQVPPNTQASFPGYTGVDLSNILCPSEFLSPIHPHRRARSYNGSVFRTFHRGIRCDGCGMHPIMGPRFKSKVKEDYDLCGICFVETGNQSDYTRIDRASFQSPKPFKESSSHLPRHRHCVSGVRPFKVKLESCFIQDVTVLDGTVIPPSTPFTKIWRLRNNGTIAWPYGTRLVWIGGDQLGAQGSVQLEIPVTGYPVDEELDIAVDFVSPPRPGRYVSYWRMTSPSGQKFGQRVWVMIQVDKSEPSTGASCQSHINLNFPPETIGHSGFGIIDMNAEPQEDAAPTNCMMDEVANRFGNDIPMQKSEPASVDALLGIDKGGGLKPQPWPAAIPPISYPIIDLKASSSSESSSEPVGSTAKDNMLEQTLLKELEEMGFNQIDLNKEVLKRNDYDLERSVDDLCGFAEWDPLLQELLEMGFSDKKKNAELLIKNNGSIKRVVLDLLAKRKPE